MDRIKDLEGTIKVMGSKRLETMQSHTEEYVIILKLLLSVQEGELKKISD